MKKSVLSVVITLLLMTSCNKENNVTGFIPFSSEIPTRTESVFLGEKDIFSVDPIFSVGEKDLEAFINYKFLLAKGKNLDFNINDVHTAPIYSYSEELNDTILTCYIINYNNGWEVISGDKRAPVILASAKEGKFKLGTEDDNWEQMPGELLGWLNDVSNEVLSLYSNPERMKDAPEEIINKMRSSVDFWSAITADPSFIERFSETRDDPPYIYYPTGYWRLINVTDNEETYEFQNHLLQTTWGESYPFNVNVPYLYSGSSMRAPAGSHAVAGAQMLYYLHSFLGRPTSTPTNIYCTAIMNNYNSNNFYSYGSSSTLWNTMNSNPYQAAILIADVAIKLNQYYTSNTTYAITSDLKDNVFTPANIGCNIGSYNSNTVLDNLRSNKPVILHARYTYYSGSWPSNEPVQVVVGGNGTITYYGRAFIIDGYKTTRNVHTCYYEWVYDNPEGNIPEPMPDYSCVVTYSTPVLTDIHMNWGLAGNYNDTWFTPNGNWWMDDIHNYNLNRQMIYGFYNQ